MSSCAPIEAQAEHRAGGHCAALVSDRAAAEQQVIVRLDISLRRHLPAAVCRQSVLIRHDDPLRIVRDRAGRAGVSHGVITRVALQIPLYFRTQGLVHHACLRQGVLHQRDRKRPLEDGFIGENEHALDLPFHFRLEVERQVGADPGGQRGLSQRLPVRT